MTEQEYQQVEAYFDLLYVIDLCQKYQQHRTFISFDDYLAIHTRLDTGKNRIYAALDVPMLKDYLQELETHIRQ